MTITPYLMVRGAAAAIDFYRDAFGAVETHRLVGDDGRIGHAEVTIGGTTVMLADEYPEVDAVGPQTLGGTGAAVPPSPIRSVTAGRSRPRSRISPPRSTPPAPPRTPATAASTW